MSRSLMIAVLLAASLTQIGCGDGVALTRRERMERDRQVLDNDLRQLTDDWDYLWLNEHKGHLSRWQVK